MDTRQRFFPKEKRCHPQENRMSGSDGAFHQYKCPIKMVISASHGKRRKINIPVARIHTSSASALKCALDEHAVMV